MMPKAVEETRDQLLEQLEAIQARLNRMDREKLRLGESAPTDGQSRHDAPLDLTLRERLDHSPLGAIQWDEDFVVISWSKRAEEIFGWREDEVLGKRWDEFALIHEDDLQKVLDVGRDLIEGRADFNSCSNRNRRKDGTILHCDWFNSVVRDGSGRLTSMLSLAHNVTPLKTAAEAALESEEQFKNIFHGAPDAVFVVTADGDDQGLILMANTAAERMHGYPSGGLAGKNCTVLVGEERASEIPACLAQLASDEMFTLDIEHVRRDGTRFPVEVTGRQIVVSSRPCVLAFTRDVSDRKQTEQMLRESERRFRAIFATAFQFVGLMEPDGTMLEANDTALAFGGMKRKDVLGKPFWETDWWAGDERRVSDLREAVERAAQGEFVRYTVDVQGAKSVETIDFSIKPVFDDQGGVRLLVPEGRIITEQIRAEQALRASEVRFRRLVDNAPEAVVLFDLDDARFIMANAAAERLYGLPVEQLMERGPIEMSPPHQPDGRPSADLANEMIRQACEGRTPVFEWTHRNAQGNDIPCEVRLLSIDIDGRTVVRGSVTDISERKRVDKALRDLAEGVVTESGEAFFELMARCLAEALEMDCAVIGRMRADDPRKIDTMAAIVEGQASAQRSYGLAGTPCAEVIEKQILFCSEHLRQDFPSVSCLFGDYASYAGMPLTDSAGRAIGLIAVMGRGPLGDRKIIESLLRVFSVRVTSEIERQNAAAELEETRAILGAAIEASPAGIIVADAPDVRIRSVNSAAVGIRDAPACQLTDIPVELHPSRWQCTHPDGTPYEPEDLPLSRAVLKGEVSRNVDVIIERAGGQRHWVLGNAAPVRNADGQIIAGVVVFPDVTDQKLAEETLRKMESELAHVSRVSTIGEMVGGLAHELNQPLYTIQNYGKACGNLLRDDGEVDREQLRDWLDEITATAEYAGEILLRMRNFVCREPMKKRGVRPSQLVETALTLTGHEARQKGVRVEHDLANSLPRVHADAVQIQQVLVNLLRNAFDATHQESQGEPQVAVTAQCDQNVVRFCVADNGPGLPGGGMNIFDAFRSTKPSGLGLGLAISKTIIEAHGGTLDAANREDAGAAFHFTLPVQRS